LDALISRTCQHAQILADGLRAQGFEILNEVALNQVVAALPNPEGWAAKLAESVQDSGEAWFGPIYWRGREALRFSVSSWATSKADIAQTLVAIAKEKQSAATP